jgi:hypothetical protein
MSMTAAPTKPTIPAPTLAVAAAPVLVLLGWRVEEEVGLVVLVGLEEVEPVAEVESVLSVLVLVLALVLALVLVLVSDSVEVEVVTSVLELVATVDTEVVLTTEEVFGESTANWTE